MLRETKMFDEPRGIPRYLWVDGLWMNRRFTMADMDDLKELVGKRWRVISLAHRFRVSLSIMRETLARNGLRARD